MTDMLIEGFVCGLLETNTYVIGSGSACAIVDPSRGQRDVLDFVASRGLKATRILLTHGHGDHIDGVREVREAFPEAEIVCPADDEHMLADAGANLSRMFGLTILAPPADVRVRPGETVSVGESSWRVLDTSGHTSGGVSYHCPEAGAAIVGDALFAGSIGRTDIPGGDTIRLIENIREQLLTLSEDTRILPGHGPETTVARERRSNPFLR